MTDGWSAWSAGKGVCVWGCAVGSLGLKKSRLRGILHEKGRARLFPEEYSRMRGFGHRLEQGNFMTDTRFFFFLP